MSNQIRVSQDKTRLNDLTFEEREKQIREEDQSEEKERELARKSPYKSFIQLNKEAYKAEDWLMAKSPIAYRVFKFLINSMDTYNAVMCSHQVLMEQFDVSKTTITRAVRLLKEKQYIDIHKSGTSNVYSINKNIAWNSWGSNFKYAKFGANIILSESEQEERIKLQIKKYNEIKIKE